MSPLRVRMIEDMTLAGLAAGMQKIHIQSVRRLAAHYRRSPDQLSEEEVRVYLLGLRQGGAARGTFKTSQYMGCVSSIGILFTARGLANSRRLQQARQVRGGDRTMETGDR
jgi:hypothetical protein